MSYTHKCPQCGKAVDPLRARAVALIDGNFLYFCSQSCRERLRAGRDATQEVSTQQILDVVDAEAKRPKKPEKPAPIRMTLPLPVPAEAETLSLVAEPSQSVRLPPEERAAVDATETDNEHDLEGEETRAGSPLTRLAIGVVVLLLVAGGLVLFFLRTS